jgi:hypothetical protein
MYNNITITSVSFDEVYHLSEDDVYTKSIHCTLTAVVEPVDNKYYLGPNPNYEHKAKVVRMPVAYTYAKKIINNSLTIAEFEQIHNDIMDELDL